MQALSDQPEILAMVEAFLARHGHRCLREVSTALQTVIK